MYLGTPDDAFKRHVYNHRKSFDNKTSANDITLSTLSKYMWELNESSSLNPTLAWSIAKTCLRCLHKKLEMINYPRPDKLLKEDQN